MSPCRLWPRFQTRQDGAEALLRPRGAAVREDPGRPAEGPPLPTNTVLATSRTQGDAGAGGGSCSSLDGNPV